MGAARANLREGNRTRTPRRVFCGCRCENFSKKPDQPAKRTKIGTFLLGKPEKTRKSRIQTMSERKLLRKSYEFELHNDGKLWWRQ